MKILVIGALGQIGSELVPELKEKYGKENVIASDINFPEDDEKETYGNFIQLDVLDKEGILRVINTHNINVIYNMASILSAKGEKMPQKALKINLDGLVNVLEIGRELNIEKVIWPSSIAVFGPTTPKEDVPNDTVLQPTTMYGITKVSGELLAQYYYKKYGLDTRSVRLPGIISNKTLPGGGTTDYAVEIFYKAIKEKKYTCFVKKETVLPMMYMPDCIKALIDILEANRSNMNRCVYNITGLSFSAQELANEIKKHISDFRIEYKPDFRQEIADSWPRTIDDSQARKDWSWEPKYDLSYMTEDMIEKLREKLLG
jgi:nucleoside-diphosphate-sugar epimerase